MKPAFSHFNLSLINAEFQRTLRHAEFLELNKISGLGLTSNFNPALRLIMPMFLSVHKPTTSCFFSKVSPFKTYMETEY